MYARLKFVFDFKWELACVFFLQSLHYDAAEFISAFCDTIEARMLIGAKNK